MYNFSLVFAKLSILLLYLRVFVGKLFRRVCWIMLAIIVAYGVWIVTATIFSCFPIQYYWDKSVKGGHCQNTMAQYMSYSAVRISTDLAIFALPMPVLASLQMPRKQRALLMLVFSIGGLYVVLHWISPTVKM